MSPRHRFQARIGSSATLALVLFAVCACGGRVAQTGSAELSTLHSPAQDVIWQTQAGPPSHLVVTRNGTPYRWRTEALVQETTGFALRVFVERLDAETGTTRWTAEYQIESAVRSLRVREVDDMVILSINTMIESRDKESGDVRWSQRFDTPTLVPTDSADVLVHFGDGTLARLQPRTGETLTQWEAPDPVVYAFPCGDDLCAVSTRATANSSPTPSVEMTTNRFMANGTSEFVVKLVRSELGDVEFHGAAMLSATPNGTRLDRLLTGEGRTERTNVANFRPFDLLDEHTQVAALAMTRKLGTSLQLRAGPSEVSEHDAPMMVAPGAEALVDVRRSSDGSLVALTSENVLYRFDMMSRSLTGIVETEFSANLSCKIANTRSSFTLVRCDDGPTSFLRALRWRDTGDGQ